MIGNYPDGPIGEIAIGGIDDERAERLAIALGRLGGRARKAAPSGLVELLGLGSAIKPDVIGSWRQPPSDRLDGCRRVRRLGVAGHHRVPA